MAIEQDLRKEISSLKTMIDVMKFQSSPQINSLLKVARAHHKLLQDDLKLFKSSRRTPNLGLLNFDEFAELHLESARAFLNSVDKGY